MNIYQEAINKFGADHQILKAVEELNELATALMHFRDGKVEPNDVESEIADVEIMIEQLKIIFIRENIGKLHGAKLYNLEKKINQ